MSVSIADVNTEEFEGLPQRNFRRKTEAPAQVVKPEVQDETDMDDYVPSLIWTAGPGMLQERVMLNDKGEKISPGHDGAYHCDTAEQYLAVRKAMGRSLWLTTIPDPQDWLKCDTCSWRSGSTDAYVFHMNNAHGKPQGSR